MIDIVERIRTRLNDAPLPTEYLLDDAADEIERLRTIIIRYRVRELTNGGKPSPPTESA